MGMNSAYAMGITSDGTVGLGMRMRYDFALYIAAGLFPIVMFIAAVLKFAGNPDKKKRINSNIAAHVIVYCVIISLLE